MASFWTSVYAVPGMGSTIGRTIEARGWDGLIITDSQNFSSDCYVTLATAAAATTRIGLGVGVTNPLTRNAAVTASAIASLQAESGGRARLGVGRGDSAVANLGLHPLSVEDFGQFLESLQAYLSGEAVTQNGKSMPIRWIAEGTAPRVPVDVAATGPRVIAQAAVLADGVSFAVGADIERLRDGIVIARTAREAAGRDPDEIELGAYLVVAAHDDPSVARSVVEGSIGTMAHFSGMAGAPTDRLDPRDRQVIEALSRDYELARHGDTRARHLSHLDDDFVSRFAIVGTPSECADRLHALLTEVPLDRIIISCRSRGVDPAMVDEVAGITAEQVMKPVRIAL